MFRKKSLQKIIIDNWKWVINWLNWKFQVRRNNDNELKNEHTHTLQIIRWWRSIYAYNWRFWISIYFSIRMQLFISREKEKLQTYAFEIAESWQLPMMMTAIQPFQLSSQFILATKCYSDVSYFLFHCGVSVIFSLDTLMYTRDALHCNAKSS